jgi:hypothetical protein
VHGSACWLPESAPERTPQVSGSLVESSSLSLNPNQGSQSSTANVILVVTTKIEAFSTDEALQVFALLR